MVKNELIREKVNKYIPTYKKIGKGVLVDNMFYTGLISPRISLSYFDEYCKIKRNDELKRKIFNDYVIREHEKRKINFNDNKEKCKLIGVYSFAAPDNSSHKYNSRKAL
jgi:hypothetical protein